MHAVAASATRRCSLECAQAFEAVSRLTRLAAVDGGARQVVRAVWPHASVPDEVGTREHDDVVPAHAHAQRREVCGVVRVPCVGSAVRLRLPPSSGRGAGGAAHVARAAASRASTIPRHAAKPCHCETARARFSGFAKKPERKQRSIAAGAAGPLCEALISVTALGAKRQAWRQTSIAALPRASSCLNAHSFCDLGASSTSFM